MRRPRLGPVGWRLAGSPSKPRVQTAAPAVARQDGRWAALGPSAVRTRGCPARSAARRSAARACGGRGRNVRARLRRAAPRSLDDGARPGRRAGAGPRRAGPAGAGGGGAGRLTWRGHERRPAPVQHR